MNAEILPPEPWHDRQIMPVAREVQRADYMRETRVRFADGGVWAIGDRDLGYIDKGDVRANIAEIFARWPERFRFVDRVQR